MNQQDPLAQLRDIHLPDLPGWWPPAPGWWIVTALVLFALVAGLWAWRRHYQQRAYRRQAAQELDRAWAELIGDANVSRYAQRLSQILRRTALMAYPRQQVAALAGAEWQRFLVSSSPDSIKGELSGNRGELLASLSYRHPDPDMDLQALHALAMAWVLGHLPMKKHPEEKSHAAV